MDGMTGTASGRPLRVGELARSANISTRLVRYYEEQGLLESTRAANGYREYAPTLVHRVWQIRGLLEAGIPIRIIREILPKLDDRCTIAVDGAGPELIAELERQRDQLDERVTFLTRNRDAITAYLEATRAAAAG
jgi:DNA-binding transcriptional MerR regulator